MEEYPKVLRLATDCPLCARPLRLCRLPHDEGLYLRCSAYPTCRFAEDFDHANGALLERVSDLESELRDATPNSGMAVDLGTELDQLIALVHQIESILTALRVRGAP